MSSHDNTRETRSSLGSTERKLAYRALLQDLSTLRENGDNVQRMEKTSHVVQEVKTLLADGGLEERAKHPGEGYLDSRVLHATSDLAMLCSDAVTGNVNTYNRHELALHIRNNPEYWQFMFPREVPSIVPLFGTFAPTAPELRPRAVRRTVERQRQAELTAPTAVDKLEKAEAGSRMVGRVHKFITNQYNRTRAPLSYFHLVLDPGSFARTIENIYNISFLVKDGMVDINVDEEKGLPFIKPITETDKGQNQDKRNIAEENQFIVSLDMKQWKEFIEAFRIREPMMVLKRHE